MATSCGRQGPEFGASSRARSARFNRSANSGSILTRSISVIPKSAACSSVSTPSRTVGCCRPSAVTAIRPIRLSDSISRRLARNQLNRGSINPLMPGRSSRGPSAAAPATDNNSAFLRTRRASMRPDERTAGPKLGSGSSRSLRKTSACRRHPEEPGPAEPGARSAATPTQSATADTARATPHDLIPRPTTPFARRPVVPTFWEKSSKSRLFERFQCRVAEVGLALEEPPCHTGLPDDAGQRAKLEFGMVRDRNGRRGASGSLLHHDVTATLSNR